MKHLKRKHFKEIKKKFTQLKKCVCAILSLFEGKFGSLCTIIIIIMIILDKTGFGHDLKICTQAVCSELD
jgi:hypothetical protein